MLLTGHKSRAIFDRYNIIHEQELLDAGDQLVRLSRATGAGGAGPSAVPRGRPRRAPSPRATRHRVRMRGPPGTGSRRRAWGRRSPDTARPGCRPRSPDEVLEAGPSPPAQRHAHSPAHGVSSRRRSHTRDPAPHSRPHRHGWHQWPAHARESATPGGRGRPRRGGGRRLGREPGDRQVTLPPTRSLFGCGGDRDLRFEQSGFSFLSFKR